MKRLRRVPIGGILNCRRCHKDLPEDRFRRIRGGTAWSPWCIPCYRAASCAYAQKHQDKKRPHRRRYAKPAPIRSAEYLEDKARLEAYIRKTDIQPRFDPWGASSASWGIAP